MTQSCTMNGIMEARKEVFSKDDLFDAYLSKEHSLREKERKIKELCESDEIYQYSQGKYKKSNNKLKLKFEDSKKIDGLLNRINADGKLSLGYFDTAFYNNLTSLQSTKNHIILICEGAAEDFLIDRLIKEDKKCIDSSAYAKLMRQISNVDIDFDFIVKKYTVDTPLFKTDKYLYPTIETMLVDVLTDKYLKQIYCSEFDNIFRNALLKYEIKIDRLLRYANKKHVYENVIKLFGDINFDIERGEFL